MKGQRNQTKKISHTQFGCGFFSPEHKNVKLDQRNYGGDGFPKKGDSFKPLNPLAMSGKTPSSEDPKVRSDFWIQRTGVRIEQQRGWFGSSPSS